MAKKAKKPTKKPAKKAAKKAVKKAAPKKAIKPAPKAAKKAADPSSNMGPKPKHGEFMWNELMTRDDEKALSFFENLLGWTHEDWPMGPEGTYRIAKTGEKSAAGIMKMNEPQFPPQVPTHWCGYIAVRDVDASAAKIKELGGELVHGPEDIPQVGRFCIFKDPTGAVCALMTPVGGVG